jgi:hypothetical protein
LSKEKLPSEVKGAKPTQHWMLWVVQSMRSVQFQVQALLSYKE